MKFIDTFNEDDKKKLTKKAKLIYSVLKKGTITRSDGVKFSYELGDNMVPSIVDGEIELFAFITKITERTYCPINEIAMSDLIMKKFEQFDIKVDLQIPKSIEIVKYKGKKPWEEPLNLNENHEEYKEKQIKKGKTVYNALKKGTIGSDDPNEPKFSYVLSDDFSINMNNLGILIFTDGIKIKELNRECNIVSTGYMQSKIRDRFEQFDIILTNRHLSSQDIEPWERPLNENHDENKLLRKGKAVYTVLKRGKINYQRDEDNEPARLTYILSDERNIFISEEGGIWITPKKIKVREENKECLKISAGRVQDLIKEKFERFNISLNLRNFNPREDWDTWLGREGLNEEEEDNNITEKDRKKIELIYGLFKRGKYTVEDILYNYVLPDEYWIYDRNETGELIVVLTMDPTQKMKLYAKIKKEDGNLYHREVPVQATQYASLYDDAKKRIKDKFERFNIEIVF